MTQRPVAVYLKPDLKARVEAAAQDRGMSASTYIRGILLERMREESEGSTEDRRDA